MYNFSFGKKPIRQWSSLPIQKILLAMKLSILMLLVLITAVYGEGRAQKVSLSFKNADIETVFNAIGRQTNYRFLYSDEVIARVGTIDITVKNRELKEILNHIAKHRNLRYKIIEHTVTVDLAGNNQPAMPSEPQQDILISGKVTAADGSPLSGASVFIKGGKGTTTDASGQFSLEVPNLQSTITVSYLGYVSQNVVLNGQKQVVVKLESNDAALDEVVVVGYGTQKRKDLTGSITRVNGDVFEHQAASQFSEMLAGTVAGFNANQGVTAAGGTTMEVRGQTSLGASTEPLIVLDGAIFGGSLRDINAFDIESIDILKDASSAAVYGAKAASGVVIVTTKKGGLAKPTITLSTKIGRAESNNQRRGLNANEYIEFREDFLRQVNPKVDYQFYTNPNELPENFSIDQWRNLSANPLDDNIQEWMARLGLFDIEKNNYLAGRTMDMYDHVFQKALRQQYDLGISGGTSAIKYYWSLGYDNNEGIRVGDQYASVRSRVNLDFKIADWLNVGMNTQFSDRNEGAVPASMDFYVNSPYGQLFDDEGNLERYPHGHSGTPLLDYYRKSVTDKKYNVFSSLYAELHFPLGIKLRTSFQPYYHESKYLTFTTISKKLGGLDSETPSGERGESSRMNWQLDNILSWNKKIKDHEFDVTLLVNAEKNNFWSTSMKNKDFSPNQELGAHGLQFGSSPEIVNGDEVSTGDALMARINYNYLGRYLLTASVRRDGYSAFGLEHPRAVFPAVAFGWVVSDEKFFKVDFIDRMKIRTSWGANGNRDIGIYAALATTGSNLWYNGSNTEVGVFTSSLQNSGLRWEKTTAINLGLDLIMFNNKIDLTADLYQMNTTDLLMDRTLPRVTGFKSITSNLGEIENKGIELTVNSRNINRTHFSWNSSLVFSLNRNKIKELFGDVGTYTLLGKEQTGEVPDFTNKWFPGQAIDVVWDYNVTGVWQLDEAEEAAKYSMQPGDFKSEDVNADGKYVDVEDKQFIGYTVPRYRLGLRNDFSFLQNFTASVFIRADLGHIGPYVDALNIGYQSNDRWNRNVGPVPYWTADKPNNEYARLNVNTGAYGGGLSIYKPRSFVRIQDVSLAYRVPIGLVENWKLKNLELFASIRNLATFTKWPGWDPESGMTPMPRIYTFGFNLSL